MAIRALFFAAAIALLCATPALGVCSIGDLPCICAAQVPGQEWRCAKCSPSTVLDKTKCYANEGQALIDSDAIVTCSSLTTSAGSTSCNNCLKNIAYQSGGFGQYNDWRCLKCTDPALRSATTARDTCYSLVQSVAQADDVLTCAKTYANDLARRTLCNTCLTKRTNSGTWPCMSCAAKGSTNAASMCFTCLNTYLSKSWECAQL